MTERKAARRRRRAGDGVQIPPKVAAWFAGERPNAPWVAMAFPTRILVPGWWDAWAAEHKGAAPPREWEWLADPTSRRRHFGAIELNAAHAALKLGSPLL
jgi:hypothetical protein